MKASDSCKIQVIAGKIVLTNIGKESLGARFRNRPLLGFVFCNNTDKMQVGPPEAEKPNKAWSELDPTYKMQCGSG